MTDDLSFPSSWRARPPRLADDAPAPHPSNVSGRPVNPDTEQPLPSASAAQEQLADELLARLIDALDEGTLSRDLVRDALVEVAVRQHGRTLRACRADLNDAAEEYDRAARRIASDATGDVLVANELASAARQASNARALRDVMLRGDRA